MAAARDPLLSSQERSNIAKLGKLIFQEGTEVLRSLFDSYHAPLKLEDGLRSNIEILRSVQESNLISPGEWKILFPDDGSSPTSKNMEAHLLFVLLQNICGLPKPSTGWDKAPEISVEGNPVSTKLAKFYWLVSEVASRTISVGVEDMYFNLYWDEITNVVSALASGLSSYEEIKNQPMDKDDEDKYHSLLVEWTRKKIQNQDVAAHSVQEATVTINSVLQRQDETKSQLMQGPKMPFNWSNSSIIGTGSKGTKVFRGQLTSNGQEVAVKKMYKGVFDKGEAEKLRKCKHPNIIRCFGSHEEEEFFYLALELGEKNLMVCINENKFDVNGGDLSIEKCFVEVASGVVYLHENKICHRDIKPDNILLMTKNDEYSFHRFVLADFNCARDVPSGETISTNSTVGTRGWMAPEMCGVGSRRTIKVDIFSLGCVYYYTLTKKHPYGGDGETMQLSVCQNNINEKQNPSNFINHFENYKHFSTLLLRMIHADVEKRPAASEVFDHLLSLRKQKGSKLVAEFRMIHVDVEKRPAASEVFEHLQSSNKQKVDVQAQAEEVQAQKLLLYVKALSFMEKVVLGYQPQLYNDFMDILMEGVFQSNHTPVRIGKVVSLFKGHPELLVEYNAFLPRGYKIEVNAKDPTSISVVFPTAHTTTSK